MFLYQIERRQAEFQAALKKHAPKNTVITELELRDLFASWKKKERRSVFKALSASAPKSIHNRLDSFAKKEKKAKKDVILTAVELGLRAMENAAKDKSLDDTRRIRKPVDKPISNEKAQTKSEPKKAPVKADVEAAARELQTQLTVQHSGRAQISVVAQDDEFIVRYSKDEIKDTSVFPKRHGDYYVRQQPYTSSELSRLRA